MDSNTITIPLPDGKNALTFSASIAPVASPASPPTPTPKLLIGTNIADNEPIQGSAMFCDVFKSFVGWFDGIQGSKITAWDTNAFPATVTGGLAGSWGYLFGYPTGQYTLKYKGPKNALVILGKNFVPVSDGAGGWTAQVQFNSGDRVDLRTSGGLTSASLLAPDAKPGQTFRDAFVNLLKPYKVCRLMQPQKVNGDPYGNNIITDWGQRPTPSQWDQTSRGVAVEYLAELCKAANVRPWINVPYGASDAFIQGLAQTFSGFADPLFEHGNEYWGQGQGFQGNQIRNDALKLGYDSPAKGGGGDPNKAGAQYHADLTTHMAALVKPIIPGAKIVLGAQATWNAWAHDALTFAKPGVIDYLAVAAYFQPVGGDSVADVPSILATCRKWIDTLLIPGIKGNKLAADAYGCGLIGYEGRQSLMPNPANAPPNEFTWGADVSPAQFAAYLKDPMRMAQLDPAMGDLCDYLFSQCLACGMTLLCNEMLVSNWGRAGFWGLKQTPNDADNPQSLALARAIAAGNSN